MDMIVFMMGVVFGVFVVIGILIVFMYLKVGIFGLPNKCTELLEAYNETIRKLEDKAAQVRQLKAQLFDREES